MEKRGQQMIGVWHRGRLYLVGAHVGGSLLLVFVLLVLFVLLLLFLLLLGFVVLAADVEKLLHLQHVTGTWRDALSKVSL